MEQEKEKLISSLNNYYRTVLSYGKDELIPMGEFIIKDIQEDEQSPQDTSKCRVIFTKVDDSNVQIVLPLIEFHKCFFLFANENADSLSKKLDISDILNIQKLMSSEEEKLLSNKKLKGCTAVKTISLEESDATYSINGENQSLNYSICPIAIENIRRKIKEKDFER